MHFTVQPRLKFPASAKELASGKDQEVSGSATPRFGGLFSNSIYPVSSVMLTNLHWIFNLISAHEYREPTALALASMALHLPLSSTSEVSWLEGPLVSASSSSCPNCSTPAKELEIANTLAVSWNLS